MVWGVPWCEGCGSVWYTGVSGICLLSECLLDGVTGWEGSYKRTNKNYRTIIKGQLPNIGLHQLWNNIISSYKARFGLSLVTSVSWNNQHTRLTKFTPCNQRICMGSGQSIVGTASMWPHATLRQMRLLFGQRHLVAASFWEATTCAATFQIGFARVAVVKPLWEVVECSLNKPCAAFPWVALPWWSQVGGGICGCSTSGGSSLHRSNQKWHLVKLEVAFANLKVWLH